MKKDRAELLDVLKDNLQYIAADENKTEEIKEELKKYSIPRFRMERILNDPSLLDDADVRELALLSEQVYLKTGKHELNTDEWFTKTEMKEARQFDYMLYNSITDVEFPLELENVNIVGNGVFVATISVGIIAKLLDNGLLNYNFDIQRQASFKKMAGGTSIRKATIHKKNVREIKDLLLKGQLINTTLAFNAATQTSDTFEELTYDAKRNILTINEGTRLDVLDGYHRCLASQQAFRENPELDFKFIVIISNYTTREAQQYQAQLAKATPIPKTRVQELEANRLSDTVIQHLKAESELRDRISSTHSVNTSIGQLVSYRVLSDAIDREFKMKTKLDTYDVSEYLTKFFDYLFGYYHDELNANGKNNNNLMAQNRMFAGYIGLAAEMKKNNIDPKTVKVILDNIDFSKDNPDWIELGLLDNNKKITRTVDEKKLSRYFKNQIGITAK